MLMLAKLTVEAWTHSNKLFALKQRVPFEPAVYAIRQKVDILRHIRERLFGLCYNIHMTCPICGKGFNKNSERVIHSSAQAPLSSPADHFRYFLN